MLREHELGKEGVKWCCSVAPTIKNLPSWRSLGYKSEWSTHVIEITEKLWARLWFRGNNPALLKLNSKYPSILLTPWLRYSWGLITEHINTHIGAYNDLLYSLMWKRSYKMNAKMTDKPPLSQPGKLLLPPLQYFHFCQKSPLPAWPLQLSRVSPPDSTAEQAEHGLNSVTCSFCHFCFQ